MGKLKVLGETISKHHKARLESPSQGALAGRAAATPSVRLAQDDRAIAHLEESGGFPKGAIANLRRQHQDPWDVYAYGRDS